MRERFVALTAARVGRSSSAIAPRTSLVAAPTAAARDDVLYLAKRLEKLGRAPARSSLNRADTGPAPHVTALRGSPAISQALADALEMLDDERASRSAAADAMVKDFAKELPRTPIVRLPFIEAHAAGEVVHALSAELDAHHATLLPDVPA